MNREMLESKSKYTRHFTLVCMLLIWFISSCGGDEATDRPETNTPDPAISDEALLNLTQKETLRFFWEFAESNSGAARERYHPENPSLDAHIITTGGTGFGLMGLLVGIERNFIPRPQVVERLKGILDFLEGADRFHGAWPHWIDGTTGKAKPFSPMDDGGDLVETAFLCQGLICVSEYFKNGNDIEKELASQADRLWKGVEWDWYSQGEQALFWHWSPNHHFSMNFKLSGYNEVLITYIMAAASPEHSITKAVYTSGWASDGEIKSTKSAYGIPLLVKHNGAETFGGPLFWAHYSYLGLKPMGLSDDYVNFGQVNLNQTLINYTYCVENPDKYDDYGKNCWGLTASYTKNLDGSMGYSAHAPGNDTGIIAPTAAISSMPYLPNESISALRYFYQHKDRLLGPAGFYDAFKPGSDPWVAKAYLAIDQGPQIIMIENYRTGLLWDLFMQNEDIRKGLNHLGFSY